MRHYADQFNRDAAGPSEDALGSDWTQYQVYGSVWWRQSGGHQAIFYNGFSMTDGPHATIALWNQSVPTQDLYVAASFSGSTISYGIPPQLGGGAAGLILRASSTAFYGVRHVAYYVTGTVDVAHRLEVFKHMPSGETVLASTAVIGDVLLGYRLDAVGNVLTVCRAYGFSYLTDPVGDFVMEVADTDDPADCPSGDGVGIYAALSPKAVQPQGNIDDWRCGWGARRSRVFLSVDANGVKYPTVAYQFGAGVGASETDEGVLQFTATTSNDRDGVLEVS